MQLTHDSDCPYRLGHDCNCAKTDPRDAEIARLTAERDAERAEAEALLEEIAFHWEQLSIMRKMWSAHEIAASIRSFADAHATTALAARDKATREAALREAQPDPQVKALDEAAIRDCAAGAPISAANIARDILSALSGEAQR